MLWNANDPAMTARYQNAAEAAGKLGIEVQALGVREPDDFEAAFATMTHEKPDAILMVTDVLTNLNRRRVFEFAATHRIPAMYEYPYLVREGGLMAYGPDFAETAKLVADLIDRILNGATPADLPFEQPTRFRFILNNKTADALLFKGRALVKMPGHKTDGGNEFMEVIKRYPKTDQAVQACNDRKALGLGCGAPAAQGSKKKK